MKTGRQLLCVATVPLLLAACAPSAQQEADYVAVEHSGVSPAIYDKMVHGDPLSISDIVSLSQARVNDGIMIRYIRDHQTIYYLSPPDFDYLKKEGVSQSVIDYMAQTAPPGPPPGGPGPYPVPVPVVGVGVVFGPYWHHWH
ncbi:MAG TPA: hypothetical protein VL981_07960 [Candidatus Methylacidiphilales bacterium]|nr:hypothetical protein [Candidatus Methylacidiphilales bacterium]